MIAKYLCPNSCLDILVVFVLIHVSNIYDIEGRLRVRFHKRTVHEIKFTTVMCAGRSTEVKKTLEVICGLFIELKCLDWIIH